MLRRRGLILMLASIVMGVGAAWVANNWVQPRVLPAAEAQVNASTVVTAAIGIPFGTKVEERHLRVVEMPRAAVPRSSFQAVDEVNGKVATAAILEGEILLAGRFADHESGSTLAALVTENMRAVTVRVDDVVGVAGFLLPGNRVDIVATKKAKNNQATADTILQNIKVLAVDQTASTNKNEPVIVRAVTLEMTPDQAETLVKGKTEGTIQLTLRNPLDTIVPVEPPKPAPVRRVVRRAAPRRDPTVTIIRGTQVQTEKTKL